MDGRGWPSHRGGHFLRRPGIRVNSLRERRRLPAERRASAERMTPGERRTPGEERTEQGQPSAQRGPNRPRRGRSSGLRPRVGERRRPRRRRSGRRQLGEALAPERRAQMRLASASVAGLSVTGEAAGPDPAGYGRWNCRRGRCSDGLSGRRRRAQRDRRGNHAHRRRLDGRAGSGRAGLEGPEAIVAHEHPPGAVAHRGRGHALPSSEEGQLLGIPRRRVRCDGDHDGVRIVDQQRRSVTRWHRRAPRGGRGQHQGMGHVRTVDPVTQRVNDAA